LIIEVPDGGNATIRRRSGNRLPAEQCGKGVEPPIGS
jgi:hypothetical protein